MIFQYKAGDEDWDSLSYVQLVRYIWTNLLICRMIPEILFYLNSRVNEWTYLIWQEHVETTATSGLCWAVHGSPGHREVWLSGRWQVHVSGDRLGLPTVQEHHAGGPASAAGQSWSHELDSWKGKMSNT